MNKKHGHKLFKWKNEPTKDIIFRTTELEDSTRYKITKDTIGNYIVHHVAKDCHYAVDTKQSTCSCPAYAKWGFCKHVIYFLQKHNLPLPLLLLNGDLPTVEIQRKQNLEGCIMLHQPRTHCNTLHKRESMLLLYVELKIGFDLVLTFSTVFVI
jgi:hypothetical protein